MTSATSSGNPVDWNAMGFYTPPNELESSEESNEKGGSVYCNKERIGKIATGILSAGAFGLSSYYLVKGCLNSYSIQSLSLAAFLNGASITPIFHVMLSPEDREWLNRIFSAASYEWIILPATQIYLNLASLENKEISALPFVWFFGVLQKDWLQMIFLSKENLSLQVIPPKEDELIQILGFTTRDRSKKAKIWLAIQGITAIALPILNFTLDGKLPHLGEWQENLTKIGFFQDLNAMLAGSILGNLLARIIDDYKEKKEKKYESQLIIHKKISKTVKALRVVKNISTIIAPIAIGGMLAIPANPNSLSDYCIKVFVGGVYGANQFILQREFENPHSYLHPQPLSAQEQENTIEKIERIAKYSLIGIFLSAFSGFMISAAVTNPPFVGYGILIFLVSMFSSFVLTGVLGHYYNSKQSSRMTNELIFRFLFAGFMSSILYQYFTTKIDIDSQSLERPGLKEIAYTQCGLWGLVIGSHQGQLIQSYFQPYQDRTPAIAIQESAKLSVALWTHGSNAIKGSTNLFAKFLNQ